jgi:hypothetical protein
MTAAVCVGTIIEAFENAALLEISDHEGVTLAMLTLPYDALAIAESIGSH